MRSIGIKQKILSTLDSMNLKQYYFECGIILLKTLFRGSILYACEVYYNLKETELRELEKIEEGFLRQLFSTSRNCPISQLYLESGLNPIRFEIQKRRLMFFKYILDQNEQSLLKQFLLLQFKYIPQRGIGLLCVLVI